MIGPVLWWALVAMLGLALLAPLVFILVAVAIALADRWTAARVALRRRSGVY